MKVRLDEANVVVTATHFNPSVFNQIWFTRNGLATEAEVTGEGCVFSESFSQVLTNRYHLMVTPVVFQLSLRGQLDGWQTEVLQKVSKMARLLRHTPFKSLGLNFRYLVKPERRSIQQYTKDLFLVKTNPLYASHEAQDAKFGGYISFDIHKCRLKLDMKPVVVESQDSKMQEDWLLLGFNFHHELADNPKPEEGIVEAVDKWETVFTEAQRMIERLIKEDV